MHYILPHTYIVHLSNPMLHKKRLKERLMNIEVNVVENIGRRKCGDGTRFQ